MADGPNQQQRGPEPEPPGTGEPPANPPGPKDGGDGGEGQRGSGTSAGSAGPLGGRPLAAAVYAAALTLLVLGALQPWPGEKPALFGTVPLVLAVPALAAAALLLAGLGDRRTLRGAAVLAALTAAGGLLHYLSSSGEDGFSPFHDYVSGFEAHLYRTALPGPVAGAVAALAAAVAAVACLLLALRRPGPSSPQARDTAEAGRRGSGQRMLAASLAGVLAAGLLVTGAGYGAHTLQRHWIGDPSPVDAVADSVPPEERGDGQEMDRRTFENARHTDLEPTGVAWTAELSGPAALTSCTVAGEMPRGERDFDDPLTVRSTLVSVLTGGEADAVVGHGTADGSELWRYTVRHGGSGGDAEGRLGPVGVSELCTVHLVVGDHSLITLDGASGEVLRQVALPGGRRPDPEWNFVREAAAWTTGDSPAPLVALPRTSHLFLESSSDLVEVEQATGEIVSLTSRDDISGCRMLLTANEHEPQGRPRLPLESTILATCPDQYYTEVQTPPSGPGLHRGPARQLGRVPVLGCAAPQSVAEFRRARSGLVITGQIWCSADEKDHPLDGKVLAAEIGSDRPQVLPLPDDTEFPLDPIPMRETHSTLVWLADGVLYDLDVPDHLDVGGGPGSEYIPAERRELYAGEPLDAVLPQERYAGEVAHSVHAYAVTRDGTVLALLQDPEAALAADRGALIPLDEYAALPDAAGTCDGTRTLTLDRAGPRLLTWCETADGTSVTAVATEVSAAVN